MATNSHWRRRETFSCAWIMARRCFSGVARARARGRVRRICLLTEEGEHVNIVRVSEAGAEDMIKSRLARSAMQENQFKYGVERVGINQLDGRGVKQVPVLMAVGNGKDCSVPFWLQHGRAFAMPLWDGRAKISAGEGIVGCTSAAVEDFILRRLRSARAQSASHAVGFRAMSDT
jgi:hypothetical protein